MMNPIDQKSEMSASSQKNFEVRFQRNCRTYFGGEDVVGFVDIDYKTWTEVNQISLLFRGETLACWQDNENGDGSSQNTIRAHRCHWKEPISITNISQGIVKNGIITFPFKVKLPEKNLPSSFESKFGAIRYWFKTSILPDSLNCQHPFTVLEKINVNNKKYQRPISSFTEKVVNWMCFRYGGINLSASIDRAAYCSGEAIAINCRAHNKTRREMGGIKARLVQTIRYRSPSQDKLRECQVILKAIGGNRIPMNHTKVWDNQLLWIPSVPPTNNHDKNYIEVTYHVQVSLDFPNDTDLIIKLPVTIGTIPWCNNKTPQQSEESWDFTKCTDGSDCFNRSSKRFQFPMQPFIPSTVFVHDYHYLPSSKKPATLSKRICNDERQPLLQRNS